MNDRELLELIATQVGALTKDVSEIKEKQDKIESELGNVKSELGNVKNELSSVKRITLDMEQTHGQKLTALFDGYKQNADKLDRIETEVSRHEEVIIRRIK